jgi:hypothetical protein
VKKSTLNLLADELATLIRSHVQLRVGPLEQQLRELTQRLDAQAARIAELEKVAGDGKSVLRQVA